MTWKVRILYGRGDLRIVWIGFPDYGAISQIPENVAEFATRAIIPRISTNLRIYGISLKFRRVCQLYGGISIWRENSTHGRKTLLMARIRCPDFGKRYPDFRKRGRICDPGGYCPYPHQFSCMGLSRIFWHISRNAFPPGQETLSMGGKRFPDF